MRTSVHELSMNSQRGSDLLLDLPSGQSCRCARRCAAPQNESPLSVAEVDLMNSICTLDIATATIWGLVNDRRSLLYCIPSSRVLF